MSITPDSPRRETPAHPLRAVEEVEPQRYVGLATRFVAAVIDAALITVIAVVVEFGAALVISLIHLPKKLDVLIIAIGGAVYILWTIGYFVTFWSTTGQTPGNRVMQIRVVTSDGDTLKPRRAFVRVGGVVLAALPLFAGFLLILFDSKRRGLQDRIARTLVVEAPALSIAAAQRERSRAARELARDRDGDAPP
jgi:uncharacterized RDD family membrane protein YckC